MMYKLYYQPGTASFVVHWLMIEMDLPHELILVDFTSNQQKSPEYLKINPNGVVPTLQIENQYISEFAAISMYLVDKYAAGKLAPAQNDLKRAEYNQWMFYISNTIQPAFRNWFYPDEFGSAETTTKITQNKIESIFSRCEQQFADGRKFFLGDKLSTVDFLFTMMMRWSRNMTKPADSWPHLSDFSQRMKQLQSFKVVNHREGLTDWS